MKALRVLITGTEHFGKMLAASLQETGVDARYEEMRLDWRVLTACLRADYIYYLGGVYGPSRVAAWLTRLKPVIMHWIGTDVMEVGREPLQPAQRAMYERSLHWAVAPWLTGELSTVGIAAVTVPLTAAQMPQVLPSLPPTFRVLVYLPAFRSEFYGRSIMERVMRVFPQIAFAVIASDGSDWDSPPANVKFLGWTDDMSPVYEQTTVLLRFPQHDGLSRMVMEALGAGRHVLWTHHLPGVRQVASYAEIVQQLQVLLDDFEARRLRPNQTGRDYIESTLLPHTVLQEIRDRLLDMSGRRRKDPG